MPGNGDGIITFYAFMLQLDIGKIMTQANS
jgi:hypothetical protein